MKLDLSILVVTVLLASAAFTASAADVTNLSTLNEESTETVSLPQVSATTTSTIAPAQLGGNTKTSVIDLSTLGKKSESSTSATKITGATPVTVTPMFAIKNANASGSSGVFITGGNTTVYTPAIAIFGGA